MARQPDVDDSIVPRECVLWPDRLASVMHGSCLCGGVRFAVSEDFEFMAVCDCTTCKKISGGTGTAGGLVRTGFCFRCGTNLFGSDRPAGEHSAIRLTPIDSRFDDGPEFPMFTRSLAQWETLPDDGLARFDDHPS